ncbi:MAG: adenylate/guanylate cyclase domain-containing protein [Nitrososphaeraceae archaeon]
MDAKTDHEFKTYYILYFDLVGSSRSDILLEKQILKLNDFNDMIHQTINKTVLYENSYRFFPDYYSSTGDGAVFCFTNPSDPFEFSVVLHSKLYRYNKIKSVDSKIHIRTGISSGLTSLVRHFDRNMPDAPWGRSMVIAKRIMDNCNIDQILVDNNTVDQVRQIAKGYLFTPMGKHKIKHGDEIEIYALIYENKEITESMFGNKVNITIGTSDPIVNAGKNSSD